MELLPRAHAHSAYSDGGWSTPRPVYNASMTHSWYPGIRKICITLACVGVGPCTSIPVGEGCLHRNSLACSCEGRSRNTCYCYLLLQAEWSTYLPCYCYLLPANA